MLFQYDLCDSQHVTIEQYVDGEFVKYVNNTDEIICVGKISEKSQALVNFT